MAGSKIINYEIKLIIPQLITLFFGDICEAIDADIMSQELQMKEVITAEEGEQIRKIARHSGNRDACLELLLKIPHRVERWYETFLEVLIDNGHHKLVEKVDDKIMQTIMRERNKGCNSATRVIDEKVDDKIIIMQAVTHERNKGHNSATRVTDENVASHISFTNSTLPIKSAAHAVPQSLSVNAAAHPVSQSPTIPREFNERVLTELAELKSLVHTQAQYLRALLGKTEFLIGRVDSLEHKLNSLGTSERVPTLSD